MPHPVNGKILPGQPDIIRAKRCRQLQGEQRHRGTLGKFRDNPFLQQPLFRSGTETDRNKRPLPEETDPPVEEQGKNKRHPVSGLPAEVEEIGVPAVGGADKIRLQPHLLKRGQRRGKSDQTVSRPVFHKPVSITEQGWTGHSHNRGPGLPGYQPAVTFGSEIGEDIEYPALPEPAGCRCFRSPAPELFPDQTDKTLPLIRKIPHRRRVFQNESGIRLGQKAVHIPDSLQLIRIHQRKMAQSLGPPGPEDRSRQPGIRFHHNNPASPIRQQLCQITAPVPEKDDRAVLLYRGLSRPLLRLTAGIVTAVQIPAAAQENRMAGTGLLHSDGGM